LLEAAGVDGRQVDGGSGGGGDQDGCAEGVSSLAGALRLAAELGWPGPGVWVTGAEATVSDAEAAFLGAEVGAGVAVSGAGTGVDGAEVEAGGAAA